MRGLGAALLFALPLLAQDEPKLTDKRIVQKKPAVHPSPPLPKNIPGWLARHQRDDGLWPAGCAHAICGRWSPGRCGDTAPFPQVPRSRLHPGEINEIERLLAALESEDYGVRERATRALAKLDHRAGAYLRRRLPELRDPEAHQRVMQALEVMPAFAAPNREVAVTALALLAYLGAGYTHQSKETRSGVCIGGVVAKGMNSLAALQHQDGGFVDPWRQDAGLAQVLATFALSEAFGLTRDPGIRFVSERALRFMVKLQAHDGGWSRDGAGSGSDPLTTLFAMWALKSAELAELDGSTRAVQRLWPWVKERCGPMKSRDTPELAAVALYGMMHLRQNGSPWVQAALTEIHRRAMQTTTCWDAADWHAACCALFQYEGALGPLYKDFAERLRSARSKTQILDDSCSHGSWAALGARERHYGPVWCAALSILSMEVYSARGSVFSFEGP